MYGFKLSQVGAIRKTYFLVFGLEGILGDAASSALRLRGSYVQNAGHAAQQCYCCSKHIEQVTSRTRNKNNGLLCNITLSHIHFYSAFNQCVFFFHPRPLARPPAMALCSILLFIIFVFQTHTLTIGEHRRVAAQVQQHTYTKTCAGTESSLTK